MAQSVSHRRACGWLDGARPGAAYACGVFRRSKSADDADAQTPTTAKPEGSGASAGKGHATPKRRDAEAARKTVLKVPADPKAAKRAMRERDRVARAEQREAMMRGDERALPQRDRGPARAFVRQWVDSRRLIAEFFLPLVVLVLIFTLIPNEMLRFYASISWYAILLVVIVDLTVTGLRLSRALKAQFPDKADRKGAVFYGIMRAMQIRRLRVPLPQVKAGGAPVPPKKPRTR